MTNLEALGVKCVRIEGDSKVLHVQFPKEIKDKDVRLIAILAKIIEEGKASVSLDEIDGRPAILLTISGEGFPLHLPVGKAKNGTSEMTDDLKPKLGDVPDELTNDDEELLRQVCRDFVAQEAEQKANEEEREESRPMTDDKTDKPKTRIAIVKVGQCEARFDGRSFTSEDQSTANILNSSLEMYHRRPDLFKGLEYWPDTLACLARAIAKRNGGDLVSCDPIDYSQYPEGAVF